MSDARPPPLEIERALADLPPDLGHIARDLLAYKALLHGDWWGDLAERSGNEEEARVLRAIHLETLSEARRTLDAMAAWHRTPTPGGDVVPRLRARMLTDLLYVKESTTEAYLLAGMRAPTNSLRNEFLRLADVDRRHADDLRALLGARSVERLQREGVPEGASAGAYEGRGDAPSLSQRVVRAVEGLRADGQEPSGLVLSAVALRHARDEGLLGPDDGTALGLPVDVDFGWRGECFCVQTRERVNLAEIIAERSGRQA
jgi:hypothetical protein